MLKYTLTLGGLNKAKKYEWRKRNLTTHINGERSVFLAIKAIIIRPIVT